jgi:biopolymer transport protein ExbD
LVSLADVCERLRIERELDPDVNCVIRADRDLPYKYVLAVMAGCAQAKIRNITFSAVRHEDSRI